MIDNVRLDGTGEVFATTLFDDVLNCFCFCLVSLHGD